RAHAPAIGEPGKTEHHEGAVGGSRVARAREQARDGAVTQVEILGSARRTRPGAPGDEKAEHDIDRERGPDDGGAHGRVSRSAASISSAVAVQRSTATLRMSQTAIPNRTQNRNAPFQRSMLLRTVYGSR